MTLFVLEDFVNLLLLNVSVFTVVIHGEYVKSQSLGIFNSVILSVGKALQMKYDLSRPHFLTLTWYLR